ncbi:MULTISPECIES: Na+/H+ antiporter NhaA [unclassified Sphingomonas]|uniref:Na+/H+ antiporter NhaA n=1 Tax=unclassified Sphingomonas TaxID=196159 RepID=UPI0022699FFC|nr:MULTISPECIES: Na+/H+ antiporter NhaA [unclassified Sphingomonas]
MGLSPRRTGATAARARHSPAAAAFLDRIEPFFAGSDVSGGPLLLATVIALAATNSGLAHLYERFWDTPFTLSFGASRLSHSLAEWIDHALLPLFFIIIGADVKREIVRGELSQWRTAAFPVAGAIGGMIVPVALFLLINHASADKAGWGTVVTMDTAFGLAAIGLFATRLPPGVRALFLAFAAIDDIGGLLVIAIAYTETIHVTGLVIAGVALLAMIGLRRLRWVASLPFVLLALVVWGGIFAAGVHATIAGVLIGLLVPVTPRLERGTFADEIQHRVDQFQEAHREADDADDDTVAEQAEERAEHRLGFLHEMTAATSETSERVIVLLTPWISYVVLPLFALSNVRIHLSAPLLAAAMSSTLVLGVVAGLVIGKPLGFLSFSWAATRLGAASLPDRVTWAMIGAIGALAGIGFTVSLFIAGLAFPDAAKREEASLGVLLASIIAGLIGYWLLRRSAPQATDG